MAVEELYRFGVWAILVAASVCFPLLLFVAAPYGRHVRSGWGPTLRARAAWVVMEAPAPIVFAVVYAGSAHSLEALPLVFLALWQIHYVHRSFVYPLLMRRSDKRQPLLTFALAIAFNLVNGSVNALAVAHLGRYPTAWLADPRFALGAALFVAGLAINVRSDAALRRLRGPGESGYRIPTGGLFERVTSPNYLGELVEWCGWALATWSAAGLAFAVFTAANLVPRALAHRRWYRARFPDYPSERKAIIPGIL